MTKTQIEILKVFTSKIDEKFSIKQVSELIKKPYPLVHRSTKLLIKSEFIEKDKKNLLSLNYNKNHSELAYIEAIRERDFLRKNKIIALFAKDAMKAASSDFFIFLIFGSCAKGKKKPNDIDVLFIIEDKNKIEAIEKNLDSIASNFSLKFDINIISTESVYEMLSKRDEINVMNETLNNHILIFGAENYFRLIKNAR